MLFRSFIMIKPEGVSRGLYGNIIQRFLDRGFKITHCRMLTPSKELAEGHYAEHKGKDFFGRITSHIASGLVLAIVLESPYECISTVRKMIGSTDPAEANPGTIRGDYALSKFENVIHASDSKESAEREIALWFSQ